MSRKDKGFRIFVKIRVCDIFSWRRSCEENDKMDIEIVNYLGKQNLDDVVQYVFVCLYLYLFVFLFVYIGGGVRELWFKELFFYMIVEINKFKVLEYFKDFGSLEIRNS